MNPEYRYDDLCNTLSALESEYEYICSQPEHSDPELEAIVIRQLEGIDECIMQVKAEIAEVRKQMKNVGVEAWRA